MKESQATAIYIAYLDFSTTKEDELRELASLIREKPEIRTITLQCVNLGGISIDCIRQIFEAIQSRGGPLTINLTGNNLGAYPEKLLVIMDFLMRGNITALELSGNNLYCLTEDWLRRLLEADISSQSLTELDLSDNELGHLAGEGLTVLGQYLVLQSRIVCLRLHNNKLGESLLTGQFLLQLQQLSIKELGLVSNELGNLQMLGKEGDEAVGQVVVSLSQHPTLIKLNLADNGLCVWDLEYLESFFANILQKRQLQIVDITVNTFNVMEGEPSWEEFFDVFASFIIRARAFNISVLYNRLNFSEASSRELQQKVDGQQGGTRFFAGSQQRSLLGDAAEWFIHFLQSRSDGELLLANQERFGEFFRQLPEVVLINISGKADGTEQRTKKLTPVKL